MLKVRIQCTLHSFPDFSTWLFAHNFIFLGVVFFTLMIKYSFVLAGCIAASLPMCHALYYFPITVDWLKLPQHCPLIMYMRVSLTQICGRLYIRWISVGMWLVWTPMELTAIICNCEHTFAVCQETSLKIKLQFNQMAGKTRVHPQQDLGCFTGSNEISNGIWLACCCPHMRQCLHRSFCGCN